LYEKGLSLQTIQVPLKADSPDKMPTIHNWVYCGIDFQSSV